MRSLKQIENQVHEIVYRNRTLTVPLDGDGKPATSEEVKRELVYRNPPTNEPAPVARYQPPQKVCEIYAEHDPKTGTITGGHVAKMSPKKPEETVKNERVAYAIDKKDGIVTRHVLQEDE